MALSKKMIKNIIGLAVLAVIFFIGLYIYNTKMTSKDEAPLYDIRVPVESRAVKNSLDVVEKTSLRWKSALSVQGWVMKETKRNDDRDLYLLLKAKDTSFIYKVTKENVSRPDVNKAFKMNEKAVNTHGFKMILPLDPLKGRTFKVAMIIEDETGKYYTNMYKSITIPDDGSEIKVEKIKEPSNLSAQVSLSAEKPDYELNVFIDKAENKDGYYTINGWGYMKGLDANNKITYVVLRKEGTLKAFTVRKKVRPDVTKTFGMNKVNLDSAGFAALIPSEDLEPGKYRLGLYISNGVQHGLQFSNKTVEIVK